MTNAVRAATADPAPERRWRAGERFDARLVEAVLGVDAERLPPYGMARAAGYRWTFRDAWRGEAAQWFKRVDVIAAYRELRVLSYGLPRTGLLRDIPFLEDPWETELHIDRLTPGQDEQGSHLVVSLARSAGEHLRIYPSGEFRYDAAPGQQSPSIETVLLER